MCEQLKAAADIQIKFLVSLSEFLPYIVNGGLHVQANTNGPTVEKPCVPAAAATKPDSYERRGAVRGADKVGQR